VGFLLKSVEKLLAERQITLELTPAAKSCCCGRATIRRTGRGRCAEPFSG